MPKKQLSQLSLQELWELFPIVLTALRKQCRMEEITELLMRGGFVCMSQSKSKMSFNKGYTETGFAAKVYHLHLRYAGDNDELYLRDYLIDYPDIAKKYEGIKLGLLKQYEHNRDGYTAAKTDFISEHTALAKQKYGTRY